MLHLDRHCHHVEEDPSPYYRLLHEEIYVHGSVQQDTQPLHSCLRY